MELLKTLSRTILINNNAVQVEVNVLIEQESSPTVGKDFDLGSVQENEDYSLMFESAEMSSFLVQVQAVALGEEGADALGGVHVRSNNSSNELMETVDEYGMIEDALDNLEEVIREKYTNLADLFEVKEAV